MATPLVSYAEAAGQVHRFILRLADGEIPQGAEAAPESVRLDAAAGRVLAADLHADRDQPPFPRSTRDGFACRAAEANSHELLFLSGRIRAGETRAASLPPGEVWEIMTGASVPEGADAVFMVEHAEQSADFIRLVAPRTVEPGENIVPRGAEARAGDLAVPCGTRLAAAQIALAAQCGYSNLAVAPRPRVAILSTGDELVAVEETPGPGQIRNSNSPMLAALVAGGGGEPVLIPAVADREAALDAAIEAVVSGSGRIDLLLITGGISAGRFDLVEDALTRAEASFHFGGVAIQPGKPVVFGQLPRSGGLPLPFFALPGNPISSAVTFHLFAAPLLAALGGDSGPAPRFALALFAGTWRGKPGLTRFLPAWCDFGLTPEVRLVPWQGSGDLAAFAGSNCLLVVPADAEEIPQGSMVRILLT